nr:MAG TPA: hypothetical protein [Caudoviricetes sp.]
MFHVTILSKNSREENCALYPHYEERRGRHIG